MGTPPIPTLLSSPWSSSWGISSPWDPHEWERGTSLIRSDPLHQTIPNALHASLSRIPFSKMNLQLERHFLSRAAGAASPSRRFSWWRLTSVCSGGGRRRLGSSKALVKTELRGDRSSLLPTGTLVPWAYLSCINCSVDLQAHAQICVWRDTSSGSQEKGRNIHACQMYKYPRSVEAILSLYDSRQFLQL